MENTPRGLATLALLKTRFDQGQDHLGLLEPFVADAITAFDAESFIAVDVQPVIQSRSGLRIPIATISTVLNRLRKRQYLVREGGRFLRSEKPLGTSHLSEQRAALELQHLVLAAALKDFAVEQRVAFVSEDDALQTLATFITDNKVPLLLSEPLTDSPLDRSSLPRKVTRVIARFIRERCLGSTQLASILAGLTEGMVLEDALLLRDISSITQRFQGLAVVLDSQILFAALDLTGIGNGIAAKEGLGLLREAGAVTVAFERTIGEMRRILSVYEHKLATADGRLSLYQTDLTRYALTAKLTPGDVRTISATLIPRLRAMGIVIREVPKHDRRFTLDEEALSRVLADPTDPNPDTPRIRHDVDCIAGVLTLRAGRTSPSIESSHAVFSTTSALLIHNVQEWYASEGESGTPPAVHQRLLTSLAWVKKPAAAKGIKVHELAAICAATLRPTRETWRMFINNIRQLRADGAISDDETVAIVASEMTEPLLSLIDDESEPDADTIGEAIERVRAMYRQQAETVAQEAVRVAQSEVAVAQDAATRALTRSTELESLIDDRSNRLASLLSTAVFGCAAAVALVAAVLSVPGVFDVIGGTPKTIALIVIAVYAGIGVYTTIFGPSLKEIRTRLRVRLTTSIREHVFQIATTRVFDDDGDIPRKEGEDQFR